MRWFSGVGARLGLALLVVLAAALGLVYLIVVPSLEDRLVNSRLSQLEGAADGLARELPADRFRWPDFLDSASESANARVVVYDFVGPPSAIVVVGDSRGASSTDAENDHLAVETATSFRPTSGTVIHRGARYAEAAAPVPGTGSVLLVSAPLREAVASVRFVRERLLIGGAVALVAALALGYIGALLFARRLRRLETAAERIAAGRFDGQIRDTSADEVGQLARTFDRMREQLSALDHARREFIANASHELRTPVFSLGGFLELLTEEDLDDETRREFLTTMREQVDRLAKLATELLDLSRADAGQLEVQREVVDLGFVADAVADEFAAIARAEARVVAVVDGGGSAVLGDEQRVLQIARALVENALTHTPPGTHVSIRVENGALAVEDDGPGVPLEHVPHVFDRFYRVDGRLTSGSGLGLAIAQELARAMGGAIELESEPGRTVFRLRLPAALGSRTAASALR